MICQLRTQSLLAQRRSLESYLSGTSLVRVPPQPLDQLKTYLSLAELDAYDGKMSNAIENYLKSYQLAQLHFPELVPTLQEIIGIAYLHKSEMENGVYSSPRNQCIFPMASADPFQHREDSLKAVDYFEKYLQHKPDELEAEWL